jgi:16S rRNA C967 or C1407 C5-methylase (RsmB/RsmF family)/NOL1/NOP2/fmu family ribosome biogenesis protein
MISDAFLDRLRTHFGDVVAKKIEKGLTLPASVSIRKNDAKSVNLDHVGTKIPWSDNGLLLNERPSFSQDPHFHAGAYYVQDSSSMFLEAILDRIKIDAEDGILALDACAAPGGKSILIADYLHDKGFLIANEIDSKRNAVLQENLLKWGCSNQAVSQLPTSKLSDLGAIFDLIVIDAPCSGEGMFRKDPFAVEQWSERLVEQCTTKQDEILDDLSNCLRAQGILIYSTCTMNPSENENQVSKLLDDGYELALPEFDEFAEYLVPAMINDSCLGYYLLPGISTGESLFFSVLRKLDSNYTRVKRGFSTKPFNHSTYLTEALRFDFEWEKNAEVFGFNDPYELCKRLPDRFPFKSVGLPVLEQKGKDTIPLHGLAIHPSAIIDVELTLQQALDYLRKDRISVESKNSNKWQRVGYNKSVLGWVKVLPNRVNNYYPSYYKLRR